LWKELPTKQIFAAFLARKVVRVTRMWLVARAGLLLEVVDETIAIEIAWALRIDSWDE